MLKMLDIVKQEIARSLEGAQHDLLGISKVESVNKETGEVQNFVKVDAEIPKSMKPFGRIQISVKIPGNKVAVDEKMLENSDFQVAFVGLEISYIDEKGNIYWRANDYKVKKEEP